MLDQETLLSMNRRELDDLYRRSPAGQVPHGAARGVVLIGGSRLWRELFARLAYLLAWQGKTFDSVRGRLINRITPLSINAISAEVYAGTSRFDGRSCIVIDYSKTSTLACWIRDEIRNVSPSLYLGFAYCANRRLIAFSLYFATECVTEPVVSSPVGAGLAGCGSTPTA